MTNNLQTLFDFVDDETVRNKLIQSEKRIRSSFNVLFSGYKLKAEDVLNDVIHVEGYSGIVRVEDINFYSYCEHHFAPFFGTATVIYEPQTIITGLGKIVRLVREVHARRLQIQEVMTRNIADDLQRVLEVKGALVVTRARHLCICSRGPSDDTSVTTVIYGCGTFADHARLEALKSS